MLRSPASGNRVPSASDWIGRLAVAFLRPASTSAASVSETAGVSSNAKTE